jgi:ElaB/YqjD/DUF883 family membrane-anchored ribosome-binding protein
MAKSKPVSQSPSYPEIDDIRGDIESLKSNVVELTKHIKQDGKTHGAELKGAMAEQLINAKAYSHKKYDDLEGKVKKHPAQSIAAAFAAGCLINMLLKRR